ncbi:tetratricopeptide repeat protein [Methanothermococcus okinawensis]|uniref:tetratricopeptide repeat protein n=1 Tax=Methanothermococcus okinawensis TaxID=155863 RepID=UPI0006909562|nr:tetratricopeptide repeat protein [Methanothermococcus okinawensis]
MSSIHWNIPKLAVGIICFIGVIILAGSAYSAYHTEEMAAKYTNMGIKEYSDGNYEKSIEYFKEALKYDPNYPWAWYNMGNAYGNENQFHHYDKLPSQTYCEAGLPDEQKKYDEAIKCYNIFIKLDPKDAALGYSGIGNSNYLYYDSYLDRKYEVLPYLFEALKHKDEISKNSGKEGVAALYANIGRTYLAMSELDDALKYYKLSVNTAPVDSAYEHITWVYVNLGDYNTGYKYAQDYLTLGSKYGWDSDLGLMPAAICAYHLGKYDEAIKLCSEIPSKFPDSAYVGEAYRYMAISNMKKGNKNNAIKYLNDDIKTCTNALTSKDTSPSDIPGAYFERGLSYYLIGEYTNDTTYYKKAMNDFEYLYNHPEISNREVAHQNYYIKGSLALSCVKEKLDDKKDAENIINKISQNLNSDPNLIGWKKYYGKRINKLKSDISSNSISEIPSWIVELGH